ncbi:hypothetical protein N0V90_008294 [Kalmusia sp. IMI 367209]|nr:hypothetical protein N0V90_008294 [Kalmusia sp. IMI 367209]
MSNLHGFSTHFPAGYPSFPPRGGPFPGGASSSSGESGSGNNAGEPQFDIFEWHPAYQSCQRYFLDHAQHDNGVQAVAALVNICLPFQWAATPIPAPAWVSLVPYIRRLVITGMDKDGIMHGFFGEDWRKGVGPVHECERRNYLFTAKSTEWAVVKHHYDMSPHESVPFLKPLQDAHLAEIEGAEQTWGQWLAMQDWMVGPRAPNLDGEVKDES